MRESSTFSSFLSLDSFFILRKIVFFFSLERQVGATIKVSLQRAISTTWSLFFFSKSQ